MNQYVAPIQRPERRRLLLLGIIGSSLLTACGGPAPRTFADFMEDRIARDGTIARCDDDREGTLNDIECANARRAAAAIALRAERERREAFERESELKLEQLRQERAELERIVQQARLAAARAEREAYDALWRDRSPPAAGAENEAAAEAETDRLSLPEPRVGPPIAE